MKILVTGANGMVGTRLVSDLKNIQKGYNLTRPNIKIDEIYEFDIDSSLEDLDKYTKNCDFVFHLAGVNRSSESEDFIKGNVDFSLILLQKLIDNKNLCPIMVSSSIQASLIGRYEGSVYGESKKESEELFFKYANDNSTKVFVYRFPNLMGHSKPNYNSAVSTFCYAIANDKEYIVNDRNVELELLYIDDLIEGMFDLLECKEKHCNYNGISPIDDDNGKYCYVPLTYKVTLGEILDLLNEFKNITSTLNLPIMPDGSFAKKLCSLYLSYLPKEKMLFNLKMNVDDRGSFTELMHSIPNGQVSVNICKPGIIKGNHYHNSKWEIFMVVKGHAIIRETNIYNNEVVEFEVFGDDMKGIFMIPGWIHMIKNASQSEELITIMIANEKFNKFNPDTYVVKELNTNE